MRQCIAWAALLLGLLMVVPVPLLWYAAFHGWLAGGPPTTPERREAHLFRYFAALLAAIVSPIVGSIVFRRLQRSKATTPDAGGDGASRGS